MVFNIHTRAEFTFNLDISMLDLLMTLSGAHYDATCRGASMSMVGGFLLGWKGRAKFMLTTNKNLKFVKVTATFRELDLISKILEMRSTSSLTEQQLHDMNEFNADIAGVLHEANKLTSKWQMSYRRGLGLFETTEA